MCLAPTHLGYQLTVSQEWACGSGESSLTLCLLKRKAEETQVPGSPQVGAKTIISVNLIGGVRGNPVVYIFLTISMKLQLEVFYIYIYLRNIRRKSFYLH